MFPILIDFHFLSSVILSQACNLWIGFPHSIYFTGCCWNFFQEDWIGWKTIFFSCSVLDYENNTWLTELLHTFLVRIKCLKNSIYLCFFFFKNLIKKYFQQLFIYYSFCILFIWACTQAIFIEIVMEQSIQFYSILVSLSNIYSKHFINLSLFLHQGPHLFISMSKSSVGKAFLFIS